MKTDERYFLDLCKRELRCPYRGQNSGVFPRDLINSDKLQMNHKRAWYLLCKCADRGWYEYGTTLDMGWMTEKGMLS